MKVKNVNGVVDGNCTCGSWLQHWRKYSGQLLPDNCPVNGCLFAPEVGAHVQKDFVSDNGWYIIPLCKKHSAERAKSVEILGIRLVPANIAITCAKNNC